MPYALKGHHLWEEVGAAVGFAKTGGYNLGSGELAFYGAPRTWTANVAYQF